MGEVTRETFDGIENTDGKLGVLFDEINSVRKKAEATDGKIDDLKVKIEKIKSFNKITSGIGGVLGGFIGFVTLCIGKFFFG